MCSSFQQWIFSTSLSRRSQAAFPQWHLGVDIEPTTCFHLDAQENLCPLIFIQCHSAGTEVDSWEEGLWNWNCRPSPQEWVGRGERVFFPYLFLLRGCKVGSLWLFRYGLFNIIEFYFCFSIIFPLKIGTFTVHFISDANIHVYWCWLMLGRIWPDIISVGGFSRSK